MAEPIVVEETVCQRDLTLSELAKIMHMHADTLRAHARRGTLRGAYRTPGGHYRVRYQAFLGIRGSATNAE